MLKQKYEPREDARIAKHWPTMTGELMIVREVHWEDERNVRNESLIFFWVGQCADELLISSGILVAAAEKAEIELFNEDNSHK